MITKSRAMQSGTSIAMSWTTERLWNFSIRNASMKLWPWLGNGFQAATSAALWAYRSVFGLELSIQYAQEYLHFICVVLFPLDANGTRTPMNADRSTSHLWPRWGLSLPQSRVAKLTSVRARVFGDEVNSVLKRGILRHCVNKAFNKPTS